MTKCDYVRETRFSVGEIVVRETFDREEFNFSIVKPLDLKLRKIGVGAASIGSTSIIRKKCSINLHILSSALNEGIIETKRILEDLGVPKYSFIEMSICKAIPKYSGEEITAISYEYKDTIKIEIGTSSIYNHRRVYMPRDIHHDADSLTDTDIKKLISWANQYNLAKIDNDIDPWFPRKKDEIISLKSISLDNIGLEELPKELFKIKTLNSISVLNNKLSTVPKEIGNLKALRYLNISYNNFTEFPKTLLKCNSLEELDISNNKIHKLESEFYSSFPKLYRLNISNNRFSDISTSIDKLALLEILDASQQYIEKIPKEICNLKYIKSMNFNNNNIKKIPKEIKSLVTLDYILLENNRIETIPKELSKLKVLFLLNLKGNTIKHIPKECQWMVNECVVKML